MQCAAQRDVENLCAAADSEHRKVPVYRGAHQGELPRVANAVRLIGAGMRVVTVGGRVDVPAAGDDQAVDSAEDLVDDAGVDGLRRQQRRDATGQRHTLDVDAGQEAGVHIPDAGLSLLQIGGEADDRTQPGLVLKAAQSHAPFPSRSQPN